MDTNAQKHLEAMYHTSEDSQYVLQASKSSDHLLFHEKTLIFHQNIPNNHHYYPSRYLCKNNNIDLNYGCDIAIADVSYVYKYVL